MKFSSKLEEYRDRDHPLFASDPGDDFGAFLFRPGPCGRDLLVIASSGMEGIDWEHVSVSAKKYCPTWKEMCFIKDLFWDPKETVMQLHPPRSKWINNHPTCLHLWRPKNQEIPLPPDLTVGVKSWGELNEFGQKGVPSP